MEIPVLIHHLLLACVVGEAACLILKQPPWNRIFTGIRAAIAGTGIAYICIQTQRIPVYGPFEALTYLCFSTAVLSLVFTRKQNRNLTFLWCGTLMIASVFLILWNRPMNLNEDYFMYNRAMVLLFFNLRILSAGFLIHSSAQYIAGIFSTGRGLFHGGRNTLLLGLCVYLVSEWTGSLWCLNWFGDSWHWSRGFLKAALLFLLAMVIFHLPPKFMRSRILKGTMGALPGCFMIWMIFFH
ncbi:MAG: hypothetical protein MI747_11770 [Desulfobacterales bacterium]|nr:hypothetical protein [Desulfobacterales bacterium]